MADDTLTLTLTREEAYQLVSLVSHLTMLANEHAPDVDFKFDAANQKLAQIEDFVQGRRR